MNTKIIRNLPKISNVRSEYAVLARMDGKAAFEFMLMPVEIAFEKASEYPSTVSGSSTPLVAWAGNQSEILSMDIPVSGYPNRDVTDYVEAIAKFMEPDKEKLTPPILLWKWGKRSFSPCVLVRLTKRETGWNNDGKLISCTLSISLVKVPPESIAS